MSTDVIRNSQANAEKEVKKRGDLREDLKYYSPGRICLIPPEFAGSALRNVAEHRWKQNHQLSIDNAQPNHISAHQESTTDAPGSRAKKYESTYQLRPADLQDLLRILRRRTLALFRTPPTQPTDSLLIALTTLACQLDRICPILVTDTFCRCPLLGRHILLAHRAPCSLATPAPTDYCRRKSMRLYARTTELAAVYGAVWTP